MPEETSRDVDFTSNNPQHDDDIDIKNILTPPHNSTVIQPNNLSNTSQQEIPTEQTQQHQKLSELQQLQSISPSVPLSQLQAIQTFPQTIDDGRPFHDGCYCYRDSAAEEARQQGLQVRCGGGLPCSCVSDPLSFPPDIINNNTQNSNPSLQPIISPSTNSLIPPVENTPLWDMIINPLLDTAEIPSQETTNQDIIEQQTQTNGKRPRSGCGGCKCPCAELHAAAAAAAAAAAVAATAAAIKMRKCCSGRCRCPPGKCQCEQKAVPTSFPCHRIYDSPASNHQQDPDVEEIRNKLSDHFTKSINANLSTASSYGCCSGGNQVVNSNLNQNTMQLDLQNGGASQSTCALVNNTSLGTLPSTEVKNNIQRTQKRNKLEKSPMQNKTLIVRDSSGKDIKEEPPQGVVTSQSSLSSLKPGCLNAHTSNGAASSSNSTSSRVKRRTGQDDRERKFECSQCSKRFFHKQNRDRHVVEVHQGRRPHKCNYENCNREFKNLSGLKQHQKTVHEHLRPFKCDQCDREFGQNNHLSHHILVVHQKVRMFPCKVCNQKFSNAGNRTQHMRRKHKEEYEQMVIVNRKPVHKSKEDSSPIPPKEDVKVQNEVPELQLTQKKS